MYKLIKRQSFCEIKSHLEQNSKPNEDIEFLQNFTFNLTIIYIYIYIIMRIFTPTPPIKNKYSEGKYPYGN